MQLRPYQRQAVDRIVADYAKDGNSVVVLPTGCLAKGTPILMSDLTYKNVEDVSSGDKIMSYDTYTKKTISNIVGSTFMTCLKPKPMIELSYGEEKITVTYDHPFFDGNGFYPLYQLIWGKMEARQRIWLKLLCKQYGSSFNDKKERGLQSCCNETCPRCKRIFKDSDEWENHKSTQDSSNELVKKSTKITGDKSLEWKQKRQYSRELGVVYSKIQRMDRSKKWKYKNTNTSTIKQTIQKTKGRDKNLLYREHAGEKMVRKETILQCIAKKISTSHKKYTLQNSDCSVVVKEASPYYSICLEKAPYTYYIGKRFNFLTHNSGKSLVIAKSVEQIGITTLILCPSREILSQNHKKLAQYVPESDIGVYSASFERKDIRKFTLATIQSVYKKPELFAHIPLVFVDECDLVNIIELETMYGKFFKKIGDPKVVGLTASPYRMSTGYEPIRNSEGTYDMYAYTTLKIITRMRHKKAPLFWKRIIYNINHKELVDAGYLTEITYVENPLVEYKEIPVNKSQSDYDLEAYEELIIGHEAIAVEVVKQAQMKHKSVLVFCATVEQAERLAGVVDDAEVVSGKTNNKERARIIDGFKSGEIQTVFNVGVLTTGFDHPALDSIVLLRPTRSPRLYLQMVGRLTRIAEGKTSATLYDLSDTVANIGRIETFELYHDKVTDLRTEKCKAFNNRVLFKMKI